MHYTVMSAYVDYFSRMILRSYGNCSCGNSFVHSGKISDDN